MDLIPTIIRSKRKTYSIEVHPDGRVVVRVPLRTTQTQVEGILRQKSGWIQAKLEKLRTHPRPAPRKQYVQGEKFFYLGESYPLQIVERRTPALVLSGGQFWLANQAQTKAEAIFESWYRGQARIVLSERVALFAARNGFHYRGVRISGARTRWGSCGPGGRLNFTWRLVMAPCEVIDYVVVHELAHLEIKNHGQGFWKRVAELMPDYRKKIVWLKRNGHTLAL